MKSVPTTRVSRLFRSRDVRHVLLGILVSLAIGIFSGFLGEAYGNFFYPDSTEDYYRGFRTGFFIGFVSTAIEFFYVRAVRRSWIRRVAFLPGLVVRILVLTLIVRVGLVGNGLLTYYLLGEPLVVDGDLGAQIRDTLLSMGFVVLFVILSQLSSIIGFKRFVNLVVGRYFRPISENRVFLFIDLVGSSRLARRLGNVRFHEYLSEFFYHADRAIVRTGGEVVSYVGDAVIVTWPLGDDKRRNARCLEALKVMRAEMRRQMELFETEFGVRPQFRAALHGGPVVVGECGDSRRQVTFLGDVVNMTARIEDVAKREGIQVLASQELMERIEVPPGLSVETFGAVELEGADTEFVLKQVRFAPQ